MNEWAAKRFWKEVSVEATHGGAAVLLDGRRVMTPGKLPLTLPTHALGEKVADEWRAVGEIIDPGAMPWTRSANSAIEKVSPQVREVAAYLAEYAETDLLSYRAEGPQELVLRQAETWDRLLDWAAETHGGRLKATTGVMPIEQEPQAVAALAKGADRLGAWEMTAFHDLVTLGGSYVVGLYLLSRPDEAEEMWRATMIDHDWQAEQWGRDEQAEIDAELKRQAFLHAVAFLRASREK